MDADKDIATPATAEGTADGIAAAGRRVLEIEIEALQRLAEDLPADFQRAVEMILRSRGRVVVSGIGKSGHIGRKISATLASTGTPSQFVHSSEASHGDLGMISSDDILLLISNSGETAELRDVVAHSRRFKIPTIAISSRADSTLMKAADLRLLLPAAREACAIGMAPTTSTTLTLALGDALAVALMEQRGFKPENFRVFHPGGKLGAQLLSVEQLMHGAGQVPVVEHDAPMSDALLEMTSKGFGIVAVKRDGRLIGAISDGDLRRNLDNLLDKTAGGVTNGNPITIRADDLAATALAIMNERKITALIVVSDNDEPIGVVHIHDCLRAGVA